MGETNVMIMRLRDGKIICALSNMLCGFNDSFAPRFIKSSASAQTLCRRLVYRFFRVDLLHLPHLLKPWMADPAP
jgi:hypothetical protein